MKYDDNYWQMLEERKESLAAFRGIVNACIISAPVWILFGFLMYLMFA